MIVAAVVVASLWGGLAAGLLVGLAALAGAEPVPQPQPAWAVNGRVRAASL